MHLPHRFGGNRPFNYFTFGAAVAEVELDCLTGDFQVCFKLSFVGWVPSLWLVESISALPLQMRPSLRSSC